MTITITIDVEDWFQVENLREAFPVSSWNKQEYRVEQNIDRLLAILENHGAKATFFVLGNIAARLPGLVRKLSDQGHDIESHGYGHIMLSKLSREEIYDDLKKSKQIIEDLTGKQVIGYRSPSFSITDQALDILKKLGYSYDSSVYEVSLHDRYGKVNKSCFKNCDNHVWKHANGLLEIPLPVINFMGLTLPWAGGGYFRIMPIGLFLKGVRFYLKKNSCYTFYLHPWEIDAGQPQIRSLPAFNYFRHYYGLSKTADKLITLMGIDRIVPISKEIKTYLSM